MIRFYPLFFFFICLLACQPERTIPVNNTKEKGPAFPQVPSKLGLIHQMQGRWKDSRVKGAELLISGNRFVSIYKEEVRAKARIEVFEKCPKECRAREVQKGIGYFIVHREGGSDCYILEKLEAGVLVYTPL